MPLPLITPVLSDLITITRKEPNGGPTLDHKVSLAQILSLVTGGGGGVDTNITSLADLAALTDITLPSVKIWVDGDGVFQVWRAAAGVDATAAGVQRADDWATSSIVWYQIAT